MGDCNCKHGSNGWKAGCVECDVPQMARNNYFTGKLLVERDFTDEQRYTMGKLRRHNQRLHGWGAVCGLKVHEHPNPGCQSQYVVIEPGTAIDCCGREIFVQCPEYFDFESKFLANWQKQNGPTSQPDPKQKFKIQICVSYKECPTEDVPALFDDCSCDTSSCRPNRILESHCFDVLIVDPNAVPTDAPHVELKWVNTLNITDVVKVALDADNNHLYVLTSATSGGSSTASLYVFDEKYTQLPPPFTFANAAGLDLAIAPEGDFVYVATQPTAAGAAPQISVFAAGDLTTTVQQISVGTAGDSTLRLASIPGNEGSLISFGQTAGMSVWTGVNSASPAPVSTAVPGITNPLAVALSPGGKYAYVASAGSKTISAISVATPAAPAVTIALPTTPASLAIASAAGGDILAALDTTPASSVLYFVDIPAAGPGSATVVTQTATGFKYSPTEVLLSPNGHWAYVLEEDTATNDNAYVQVVDEKAVEGAQPNYLGEPVAVGVGPVDETISADGSRLFVPYVDPTDNTVGGVSVVDILQTDCKDLFLQALDPCPDCDDGDCIVLATIKDYTFTGPIVNSEIDNITDRHLLVSTDVLTQVVRCMLGQDGGGGQPGRDGAPGPAGPGIDQVGVTFVPCDQPGSASITGVSPNRTLNLVIPGDCNKDLVGVANVSWAPASGVTGSVTMGHLFTKPGLKIAFTSAVQSTDLTSNTISLLAPVPVATQPDAIFWAEVPLTITPGNFATVGDITSAFTPVVVPAVANGVAFFANEKDVKLFTASARSHKPVHVLVKGDFIRDNSAKQRGLDGNHLPPWVPARPSGDGIEGGTFESWFTVEG